MVRATFTAWRDRATIALMLVVALTAIHGWCADHPWQIAAIAAFVASIMIGIGTGRLVARRLSFHAYDGLLAADALDTQARRYYLVAWLGIGLALLIVVTLIARPSLLIASAPGYIAGGLFGITTGNLKIPKRIIGTSRPKWTIQAWSRHPIAGAFGTVAVLLPLLPARTLEANALLAIVGVVTLLVVLMLSSVDDAVVRFMTIAGHQSSRIIVHYASGGVVFLAAAVPGCWIILGPGAASIVVLVGAVMLLILALRILAYQLFPKRIADLIVSVLVGLLMLTAYSLPPAMPFVALAIFWHLQRRTRAKRWLLA